jgi:hypothetical protein
VFVNKNVRKLHKFFLLEARLKIQKKKILKHIFIVNVKDKVIFYFQKN